MIISHSTAHISPYFLRVRVCRSVPASRGAVGMSGAVMLGEVGDLVQCVVGAKAGGDGENVGP